MGLAPPIHEVKSLAEISLARSSGFEPEFGVLETPVLPIRLQPNMEQDAGIEPALEVYKTPVLPLN